MSDQSVILADQPKLPAFQISPAALATRDEALANSALIARVTNADQNKQAVDAQVFLKRVASSFESARKKMKEPLLEAGRQLDRTVAKELAEVEKEMGRLSVLAADFQRAEARRVREEQELQARELARIEAEKIAALANATTTEQVQKITEAAQAARLAEVKPVKPTRATGQVVKEDWEITVTNPYDLAKFHPDCVKIEPLLTPIKQALNAGISVKGITAMKVTKASVRAGTAPLIEV